MPDYRPIPGGGSGGPADMPMDDLTRMASERASSLLMPYQDKFGAKSITPSQGSSRGELAASTLPSNEDRLFRAVHPETFSKIMETILSLVTGKPIPRQMGGDVEPGQEYVVGEKGPEKFKPDVPGQITPYSQGPWMEKYKEDVMRGISRPSPLTSSLSRLVAPEYRKPLGLESAPIDIKDPETGGFMAPQYKGTAPWRQRPIPTTTPPGGWTSYDEGMRYKLGPETPEGDRLAQERILAEAGRTTEKYGIPVPGRSYYEAHPEERIMDIARSETKPLMDEYQKALDRYTNLAQGYGLPMGRQRAATIRAEAMKMIPVIQGEMAKISEEPGEYYKKALEFGPETPETKEKLAHAEYLRRMPEVELAKISEEGRVHLEGIQKQVEGHLGAAKIAAESKDPIMKEIGAILTQGQKNSEMYGIPFDPEQTISSILGVYRAMGEISDEQWAKLPKQYKPPVQGARLAPDGNWYVADPKRPGKYLKVG
jgi:hypothetical protein